MVNVKKTARNILSVSIGAALVSVMATATTAHAADWTKASAPITYKGSNPYATGYRPAPVPQVQVPQMRAPQAQLPRYQAPQYRNEAALPQPKIMMPAPRTHSVPAPAQPGMVDRNLYKHQKVGKPYTVAGQTYYPQHDPSYDRVGVASWYGDKFHGKLTANGETYNKNAMTAAHPTLPLNSYVNVTNLQTGQTLTVRLNDRGPFIDNRLIDLSEAAATALGIKNGGLAQVRVQYAGPAAPDAAKNAYAIPKAQPVAPVPVMPVPHRIAPQVQQPVMPRLQAQLPQVQNYKPLRLPVIPPVAPPATPPAKLAELPRAPEPLNLPQHMTEPGTVSAPPTVPGLSLPERPIAIPEASAVPNDDGSVVTLTIKGPIHMAGTRGNYPRAAYIEAVNRVRYTTK